MNRSLVLIFALASTAAPALSQAARDTARIAPVVVTATRTPLAADRSPASVSVIDGEKLRREGITTVVDALRQVPGLAVVQTGSYGGATSLFIRGGESKFAKVLIDGVAVNDAGGSFDFSNLTTDNIDRIEIVRGPASVLYGSDAMAGVVQLFTRGGEGRMHGDASARGGALHTYDGDASLRGSSDHLSWSLAGAQHRTDGIQLFNSGFRQSVGSGKFGYAQGDFDATASARLGDNVLHFPTDGSGQVVDSNAVRQDDRLSVGVDAGYRIAPSVAVRLSLSSYGVHGTTDDQPDSPGDTFSYNYTTSDRSYRRSGDLRVNMALTDAVQVTVGGQVEREWQTSQTFAFGSANGYTARRRTEGGYAQLLLAPTTQSTLALGARVEHNERFGDFGTYRAAGSMEVTAGTRLRASVGTAFREPTINENYGGPYAIGNPDLTPEHAFSYDLAVEHEVAGWGSASLTYFSNSFRDLIDYKYSATAPNYYNIARTRAAGVELEAKATLPENFVADGSLTYLDARVVDPGTSTAVTATFSPGAPLLRRPMHTLDGGIGYHAGQFLVDLRAHHVGTRQDVYYGPAPDYATTRVTLDPYTRVDLSGEWRIIAQTGHSLRVTVRSENLFDARYTDVAGINYNFAQADDAAVARTGYRAAGQRTLVGLAVTF